MQSAPDGGMAAVRGAGTQEGKFLPAHVFAIAAYSQISRTHCRPSTRYKNARFAKDYRLAEHSEECFSLLAVRAAASSSWLTLGRAGISDTFLSELTRIGRTRLTGTSLDSYNSYATISDTQGLSSCTRPKLQSLHASRDCGPAIRLLAGQAYALGSRPNRARKPRNSAPLAAFCLLAGIAPFPWTVCGLADYGLAATSCMSAS